MRCVFTTVLGSRPGGSFLREASRAFATAVRSAFSPRLAVLELDRSPDASGSSAPCRIHVDDKAGPAHPMPAVSCEPPGSAASSLAWPSPVPRRGAWHTAHRTPPRLCPEHLAVRCRE